MQVKKQQLEPDMEQWTGSKLGKEYIKAVYYHLAYLIYMQSTSWEMPGWMKHKLESRPWRNINNLRYADDTTLVAESKEELKSLLMKVKEESLLQSSTKPNFSPEQFFHGHLRCCLLRFKSWKFPPNINDNFKL